MLTLQLILYRLTIIMEKFIKYLRVIVKYRKLIVYNVLIVTVAAAIISLILPKKYKAVAQILPPSEETDVFGAISSSGLSIPRLSRLARAGSFFRSSTPSDLIGAILQSRTILERIVDRYDLRKVYKVKKGVEPAIKMLAKSTEIIVSEEGVVKIIVQAPKAQLAADIANAYIEEVDRFLKESNMSRGKSMRMFIEKRLTTADEELKQTAESLKVFQERHKIVSVDEEVKAIIETYAKLKAELLKREIELGVTEEISTPDNPYVVSIKREIDEFQNLLKDIEVGKGGKGFGVGFAVPFQKLPAISAEYARRLRDYRVQSEIYTLLVQQYEQAKILEARDTPNITILDYARVPEKRSFPKRKVIVFFALIISFTASVLLSFGLEYLEQIKQKSSLYQELKSYGQIIKDSFWIRKRKPKS